MTDQNTDLTLYLLTRTDEVDYHEPEAQVVIAADEAQAPPTGDGRSVQGPAAVLARPATVHLRRRRIRR